MAVGFGQYLSELREGAKLTNRKLASLADVPPSLIAGLQSGRRRVGEYQARKIGVALGLQGEQLESFILSAVDTCTDKVLAEAKEYPASFLNLIAKQLRVNGILPEHLNNYQINGEGSEHVVKLYLSNGRIVHLSSNLSFA